MPADWFVYTSMATTEGSDFFATASGSVRSSSFALTEPPSVEPMTVWEPPFEDEPFAACQMPNPPRTMTQASAAPAKASRNVRKPCDFFSTATLPGVCCGW